MAKTPVYAPPLPDPGTGTHNPAPDPRPADPRPGYNVPQPTPGYRPTGAK